MKTQKELTRELINLRVRQWNGQTRTKPTPLTQEQVRRKLGWNLK